jgi:hypothetical protein
MSHKIDHQTGLIVITFSENITPADLQEIGEALQHVEATFPVVPHRLIDLRAAEKVEVSFATVKAFADSRNACVLRHSVRAAILAQDNLHYGMARMFTSLSENPRVHLKLFRDYQAALDWVSPRE